jgi:hypothetical protein
MVPMRASPPARITKRAVLLGALLLVLSSFWVTNSEMVTGVTEITSTSLYIGAVFLLFVLLLCNVALERYAPRAALTAGETLTVYVMVTLGMSINGIGMFGFLTTALTNPYWYATPENGWTEFLRYIPSWFAPQSKAAITHFYQGGSTLYLREHLVAWRAPILTWSLFTCAFLWVMFCANAMLRRRWSEQEQLTYPITALPLELAVRERRFTDYMRQRLLWVGFALPAVIESWNSVQFHVPSLPYIKVKPFDVGYLFAERPWNAVGWLPVAFHPSVIGLTYFIPLDVALSCWFFYVWRKVEAVVAAALGLGGRASLVPFPAIAERGTGAWLGLALIVFWLSRRHLRHVLRTALRPAEERSADEPLPYRWAVLGFVCGLIFLLVFCAAAGMRLWAASLFFGLYLVYMLALTRIRAEGGVIWHFGPYLNPAELLVRTVGTRAIPPRGLAVLAYLQWFNLDYRSANMPHQLEGFHIARTARLPLPAFGRVVLLALGLGVIAAYWNVLHMYYAKGAGTPNVNPWRINMGLIPYRWLRNWLDYRAGPDGWSLRGVGLGLAAVSGLSFLRLRFVWWPFHPLGYAVGNTFIMDLIWTPMAISWALKLAVLRAGGIRAYRRAAPFFAGLLLGDYVTACVWSLAGVVLDVPMYRVFPN